MTRIKRHTSLPVSVGFGVRNAEQARAIAQSADGVVVGSALVDAVKNSLDANGKATAGTVKAVTDLAESAQRGRAGAVKTYSSVMPGGLTRASRFKEAQCPPCRDGRD